MRRYTLLILTGLSFQVASTTININQLGKPYHISTDLSEKYTLGYYASRDTYGMRKNAVVAAFKANPITPFDYPILGIPYVKALGTYGDRDSVGLYADNTSPPFKTWEKISNVAYTPTSFISNDIDISKIKPGMIIDTDHQPKWSSYVVSVSKGKVVTAGWVNTGTKHMGTPENGIGLTINPITKIWAANFNVFIPENGRSNYGVIQENAIINNKIAHPTAINGIDTAVLPQSKYGGTAAFLARSADSGFKQQWLYGFISQGSRFNFVSSNSGKHSPDAGFLEASKAKSGIIFDGDNSQSSITWKDASRITASIDPNGLITKIGYKTKIITETSILSENIGRYIINANKEITLTLPKKADLLAGYTLKLTNVSVKNFTITFISPESVINGKMSLKIHNGEWNKEAIYDGTSWYIY